MDFDKIGKYQIVGKIGQGAMGEVFKAHDPLLNRLVAVKTISGKPGTQSDAHKRFLREAQSAARLNHPNIITVYDLGEEQGRVFMAMELLEGTDLREVINTRAVTDLGQKLELMEQICDGLAYAHSKQVVHRDLKPGNIHIQPNGQVKIMDFGLARLGASEMTATGTVMGTPNYMSPEQVRGEKADARSDIFALGAVFYELLTSHKAFDADSIHAVLFQVLDHDPEPVRKWVPDVPEILVALVQRALEKDPARRFPDAGQMREAVRIARQVVAGEMEEVAGLSALRELGTAEATVIGLPADGEATVVGLPPADSPPERGSSPDRTRPPVSFGKGRGQPGPRGPGVSRTGRGVTVRPPARGGAPAAAAPGPPRASRLPVVLGAGVLLLVVGVAVAVWLLRPSAAPIPTPTPNITDPIIDALVASLVELANQDLKNKNYASAVKRADNILNVRADNPEARQIRAVAQAKLDEVEGAARDARSAFEAGDTDKASQALSTVMSINPNHPVVDELSQKLNRYFRATAEEARGQLAGSRTAAEGAGASRQAEFADAVSSQRKAEALFKNQEFAVATQRYLEARRNAQERPKPTPKPTAVVVAPTFAPPATTLPPTSLPPATAAPTAVPSPQSLALPLGDEPAVRRVLDDYKRAMETKDLKLLKAVKPNMSAEEERALAGLFKSAGKLQLSLATDSIQIDGAQATARVSRQDVIDGRQQPRFQQTFTLVKGPSGWTIREWVIRR
ncbi:MAG: hypothetical protein DMF81_01965 [Acidobacteria bacterium]|nr:MAG: hypothetical protein DMF81_01965 [Acidobacteriota bacterium]